MMKSGIVGLAVSALFLGAGVHAASAQATRTWVSGVGDDANPCSRTAPCKTFAGAISKTAAGGEIDALDPGGYGTLTIIKAITIDGRGTLASVLSSGTVGFTINAGVNDDVVLRNLTINGTQSGTKGVNFVNGHALVLDHVDISNVTQSCVDFEPANKANLTILGATLQDCGTNGLLMSTTSGVNRADMDRTTVTRAGLGLNIGQNSYLEVKNSNIDANPTGGAQVSGGSSVLILHSTSVSNNKGYGVSAANGGRAALSQTTVTLNQGPAFQIDTASSASIASWSNNYVAGNNPDTAPSSTIAPE